jgi:magnesium transporter
VYFRDVYDHLSKYYEMSDSARDLVTSLMEIHLSMINNRMSRISNRTNATMRRLTLITTIFMPLTLIAGIGGMSEFTMLTGGEKNANIAYLILIAVMAIIGTLNWLYLRKMERDLKDSPED